MSPTRRLRRLDQRTTDLDERVPTSYACGEYDLIPFEVAVAWSYDGHISPKNFRGLKIGNPKQLKLFPRTPLVHGRLIAAMKTKPVKGWKRIIADIEVLPIVFDTWSTER